MVCYNFPFKGMGSLRATVQFSPFFSEETGFALAFEDHEDSVVYKKIAQQS